jgi:hypothetical protein
MLFHASIKSEDLNWLEQEGNLFYQTSGLMASQTLELDVLVAYGVFMNLGLF